MIIKLDNSKNEVAKKIYSVFQNSYKIEAKLIGVVNFPPLQRSNTDIKNSETLFYGYVEEKNIAAVIEVDRDNNLLDICSLTVDPKYFKKGIASKLVSYVLENNNFSKATVETAVANKPAINLYKKHGFVEYKRWTPSHGIKKIALSIG